MKYIEIYKKWLQGTSWDKDSVCGISVGCNHLGIRDVFPLLGKLSRKPVCVVIGSTAGTERENKMAYNPILLGYRFGRKTATMRRPSAYETYRLSSTVHKAFVLRKEGSTA